MNKSIRIAAVVSATSLATLLTACGTPDPYGANNYPVSATNTYSSTYPYNTYSTAPAYPYGTYPAPTQVAYVEYGRVTDVQMMGAAPAGWSPNRSAAGGVIGAIIGGVIGNQIGSGGGRAAATVLGATAGAVIGSNAARRDFAGNPNPNYPVYRVTVQTDQGMLRTYDVSASSDLRPGDRVRIENGVIYLG